VGLLGTLAVLGGGVVLLVADREEHPEVERLRARVQDLEKGVADQQARTARLERQLRALSEERLDAESALDRVNSLREEVVRALPRVVAARQEQAGPTLAGPTGREDDADRTAGQGLPAELSPAQREVFVSLVEEVLEGVRERREQARESRAAEQRARRVEELKETLRLDEKQVEVVAGALAWEQEQRRESRARFTEGGGPPADWRETRRAIQREVDGRIIPVLTTEQAENYRGWRDASPERGRSAEARR
jgi:hypothetical protein